MNPGPTFETKKNLLKEKTFKPNTIKKIKNLWNDNYMIVFCIFFLFFFLLTKQKKLTEFSLYFFNTKHSHKVTCYVLLNKNA